MSAILSSSDADAEVPNSFFYPYYSSLFQSFQFRLESKEDPITTQTYEHPRWTDWSEIWSTPPITLDPNILTVTLESKFHSASYRLVLDEKHIHNRNQYASMRQGASIIFKGFDNHDARFVVEWTQLVENHKAYIKVVGYNEDGEPFPYTDPDNPSFILEVPVCIAYDVCMPIRIIEKLDSGAYLYRSDDGKEKCCSICNKLT